MTNMNQSHPSRVRFYWYAWLGVVAVALVVRFTVFFGPLGDHCGLSFAYSAGTWLSIIVLSSIEGHRLMSYLKQHFPQKWEEITYVPGLGSGMRNSFRSLPWLYAPDDTGDPVLAQMKKDYQLLIALILMVFFSNVIMFPLLTYDRAA